MSEVRRDRLIAASLRSFLIILSVLSGLLLSPGMPAAQLSPGSPAPEGWTDLPAEGPDTGELSADDAMEAPVPEMRSPKSKRRLRIVTPETWNEERGGPAQDRSETSQAQTRDRLADPGGSSETHEKPVPKTAPLPGAKARKQPAGARDVAAPDTAKPGTVGGGDIRDIRWGRHGSFERVVFEIYERWQSDRALSRPGEFDVDYETHPHRIVVRLEGVWSVSAGLPSFRNSGIVDSMYRIPAQGAAQVLVIALKKPVSYKAFAMGDPARVVIDLSEQKGGPAAKPMFSLRTLSYRATAYRLWETLTAIRRVLSAAAGSEARIIQARDHTLFVEEGLYSTRDEAEEAKAALMKQGYRLYVEKRGAADIPAALFDEKAR